MRAERAQDVDVIPVARPATLPVTEGEVIEQLSSIITSSLDLSQVYERFTAQVKRLIDFDRAGINIIDEVSSIFRVAYLAQRGGSYLNQGDTFPLEGSASGYVAKTGSTLVRGDLAGDTRFWTGQRFYLEGLRSSIMVPLVSKDRVLATFSLISWRPQAYGERERKILERMAPFMASAIENSLLFQEVDQLALALESIGDAVVFLDTEGKVQFINRAGQETYGYSREEVLGAPVSIFSPASPESQEQCKVFFDPGDGGDLEGRSQASQKEW